MGVYCKIRFFSRGFPHHVEDHGPSHPFMAIPTVGGVVSAAVAQPRIEPAGGGGGVREYAIRRGQPRFRV